MLFRLLVLLSIGLQIQSCSFNLCQQQSATAVAVEMAARTSTRKTPTTRTMTSNEPGNVTKKSGDKQMHTLTAQELPAICIADSKKYVLSYLAGPTWQNTVCLISA